MTHTVLGIFSDRHSAEEAINHLEEDGYNPKDISIVMKDTVEGEKLSDNTGASVASGAVSGATTGAVVGGIAGLLIGIGAIVIPGIGGLLIAGPLAAALGLTGAAATTASGAATGAVAGGLLGALVGLGVPESEAKVYEERISSGAILLAIPASESRVEEVREILEDFNAQEVRTVSAPEEHTKYYSGHKHSGEEDRRHHTHRG